VLYCLQIVLFLPHWNCTLPAIRVAMTVSY
jgi:hypothetical protein